MRLAPPAALVALNEHGLLELRDVPSDPILERDARELLAEHDHEHDDADEPDEQRRPLRVGGFC